MDENPTRRLVLLLLTAGCIVAAAGGHSARATPVDTARPFVDELARSIVAALRDPSVAEARRLEHVDKVAANAFDLDRTARIALGRHWRSASAAQQREFAVLFKDYVLTSYGRRFRDYADRSFRVTEARPAGEDVVVESFVEGGPTPVRLDWRLSPAGQGWLVLDVAVEGVSLLLTYRSEFAAVIERHGGRLDGLLGELRQRLAAERARVTS